MRYRSILDYTRGYMFGHGLVIGSIIARTYKSLCCQSLTCDEERWITIHPNGKGANAKGEEVKGRPVLIETETGEIRGGSLPASMHGKKLDDKEAWQTAKKKNNTKSNPTNKADYSLSSKDPLAAIKDIKGYVSNTILPYPYLSGSDKERMILAARSLDSTAKWKTVSGLVLDNKGEAEALNKLERQVYNFRAFKSIYSRLGKDASFDDLISESDALEKRYHKTLRAVVENQQSRVTSLAQKQWQSLSSIAQHNLYSLPLDNKIFAKHLNLNYQDLIKQVAFSAQNDLNGVSAFNQAYDYLSVPAKNYASCLTQLALIESLTQASQERQEVTALKNEIQRTFKIAKSHLLAQYDVLSAGEAFIIEISRHKTKGLGHSTFTPASVAGQKAGKPMDFIEANQGKANPHYNTNVTVIQNNEVVNPYHINCQTCVVANEMRRRGFKVAAQPNMNGQNRCRELSFNTSSIWVDPETSAPPLSFAIRSIRELDESLNAYERHHIVWGWGSGKSGHIVTVTRETPGGPVKIYDPQTGKSYTTFEYEQQHGYNMKNIKHYRVDNCEVREDFANAVLTSEKQGIMFNLR